MTRFGCLILLLTSLLLPGCSDDEESCPQNPCPLSARSARLIILTMDATGELVPVQAFNGTTTINGSTTITFNCAGADMPTAGGPEGAQFLCMDSSMPGEVLIELPDEGEITSIDFSISADNNLRAQGSFDRLDMPMINFPNGAACSPECEEISNLITLSAP